MDSLTLKSITKSGKPKSTRKRKKEKSDEISVPLVRSKEEKATKTKKQKRRRRQIRRSNNSDLSIVAEKKALGSNPRELIYSINTDYGLVLEWLKKQQKNSNGHNSMADPDSDCDDIYDDPKDSLFMRLDAIINEKETSNVMTVEKRSMTNHAFLRHVMSSKNIDNPEEDTGYSMKEKERLRAVIYLSGRDWEEAYMRPPDPSKDEQECVMGKECLGRKIENSKGGFTLVAYHFKQEVLDHKVEGKPLPPNRMCIFCLRNETLKHYLESCAGQRVYERNSAIQIHRNSVQEYHPHFMTTGDSEMRKGLIDPIVSQTLSSTHFQYVEENGRKFYRQLIPRPTPEQLKHFLM